MFLFFCMPLLCSFFRLKELFLSEKWFKDLGRKNFRCPFSKLRYGPFGFNPRKFRQLLYKLNKIE